MEDTAHSNIEDLVLPRLLFILQFSFSVLILKELLQSSYLSDLLHGLLSLAYELGLKGAFLQLIVFSLLLQLSSLGLLLSLL